MSSAFLHRIESPLGPIQVLLNGQGALVYLGFADHEPRKALLQRLEMVTHARVDASLPALQRQLIEYFEGRRRAFDFPLDLRGTPFQQRVWNELQRIPYATTLSYCGLAERLGDRRLTRAVGRANGANPVSILVPCHRVIGQNGKLTGYAGGLERKQHLLNLEKGFGLGA